MGNKILGRRCRSFYQGFNSRQIEYLQQKFQTVSTGGKLQKSKFAQAYKLSDQLAEKFLSETDFDQSQSVEQYEFICMVHSLCAQSISELATMFFGILTKKTKNSQAIDQNTLEDFTSVCLLYNAYLSRTSVSKGDINKTNQNKFKKYDYDKNKYIDRQQFIKICLKDEDYKKWMYNMGFITKRQMEYQQDVYDLVDSDVADEIDRHDKENKENISKIKEGVEHRVQDQEFQMVEEVGDENAAPQPKPWVSQVKDIKIQIVEQDKENQQPPNPSIQLDYVFGYRSFDCRNNVKFDSKGKVVYHQAAIGIVLDPRTNKQQFIIQHHDDITCIDVVDDTVVTGQTGSNPTLIMWQTNKKQDALVKNLIVSQKLKDGISNVCLSPDKKRLAVMCNDPQHKLVVYDVGKLKKFQQNPALGDRGVIAYGACTTHIPFDMKFDVTLRYVVVATIKELLFVTYQKGILNANRAIFGNFSPTAALCLQSLKCKIKGLQKDKNKGQDKQLVISGMGNGSIYFWQNQKCVKALTGHNGSVSAICLRRDKKSFISGDKAGKIIIWGQNFQKQNTIDVPKSNCVSNMIVSLSCNRDKQILIGTKSSDIHLMKINDHISKAKKIMSGHNQGYVWGLTIDPVEDFIYTGGEDRRLIKWSYSKKKQLQIQRKCPYPIRAIDYYKGLNQKQQKALVVGYKNGVVQCFNATTLESMDKKYTGRKNPDEEILNFIRAHPDGGLCVACYQHPNFSIVLLNIAKKNKIQMLSQIKLSSKILTLDFDVSSKLIRFNTQKYEYKIYNIQKQEKPQQIKPQNYKQYPYSRWATHTLPYTAETQGVYFDGVVEQDITCCERYRHVFVVGDKYSKIKLFNFPSKRNKIYNRYVGHSNEITGLKFSRKMNQGESYLISLGGQEKSIIVWKFNPEEQKNSWLIQQLAPQMQQLEIDQERKQRFRKLQQKGEQKVRGQYDSVGAQGQQKMATLAFKGQIFPPPSFKPNARKDNVLPEESLTMKHAFGLRNKYIADDVRNQVKFAAGFKQVLFPTACLAIRMSIQDRTQQFYHEHKQDIVSFAVHPSRKFMATGQMAQKNAKKPRQKIVAICVWDIKDNKLITKLDGFHRVAVVLLSFSPDGKLLFSCGNDDKNSYAIYDWSSGTILYSGPVSGDKVNGIAWKTDCQFATCGVSHVKFWSGSKSTIGKVQGKVQSMLSCVSVKSIYITGSFKGNLFNWIGNRGMKVEAHSRGVHTLVYQNDLLYSGGGDGKIIIWKPRQNGQIQKQDIQNSIDIRIAYQQLLKTVKNIPDQQYGILSLDVGKNKQQLIIGTVGASIIYKNGQKYEIIHQGHYKGELWGLSTCKQSKQKNLIITGGDDHSVRLWDIENRREVNRVYFDGKIRGLDWSPDSSKVVIADNRAQLYLYNYTLTEQYDKYQGQVYQFNKKQKNDPWVEQIKFSPNGQLIAYGSHGKSMKMQFVRVTGKKLSKKNHFTQGSSALLHLDWSRDGQFIAINTQAYQLLFYGLNGKMKYASSLKEQQWATWTRKIGWHVLGIFQGVDFSDVNTVCRDIRPNPKFIAVGYDDQCIRLFKYPCYIPNQVHKTYPGHSSHVTRIKFTTDDYMVSLGGLDRTIIVWKVERPYEDQDGKKRLEDETEDDGLDDLEEDVDLPGKAIVRKPKVIKNQQFYQVQDQGDQFMAIKPWVGAIKQPTYQFAKQTAKKPEVEIKLEYVHGYRVKDCRQNLYYVDKQTILYHAAAVVIFHNIDRNQQQLLCDHNDDILSIDYHKQSNQVITGELGPKPLVCLYKNAKLKYKYHAPVKKGVLAVAISLDGKKAACAGMDDDHCVAVLDLETGKILACQKGTKKVITRIVWTSNNTFVTVGISHFKAWVFDGKLKGKQNPLRQNFVSAIFDPQTKKVYIGASRGKIYVSVEGSLKPCIDLTKQVQVQVQQGQTQFQKIPLGVVDCLLIQKELLIAGTKDSNLCIIDKNKESVIRTIQMGKILQNSTQQSMCSSIRALSIFQKKMLVGTLGAQIYQLTINNLKQSNPFSDDRNVVKCHFSPNNTWTNQVWGLHVHEDYVFTCSDDATVRVWSISQRKILYCKSTNKKATKDKNSKKYQQFQMQKDPKTKDFTDDAKCRAIAVSSDGKWVVVGAKSGLVRVYKFKDTKDDFLLQLVHYFHDAKQWISDIKFGYNTLIIGSHDNGIYVYEFQGERMKRKYPALRKHSSYITHMDVSRDSCFLQSTCGAYQLLFWDLNTGKQMTSGATMLRDERWQTWTCNLGWPVQGIYPKVTDGTFINSVDRSNLSINNTQNKKDFKSLYLLAAGNDNGKVAVYNYPCTIKNSEFVEGKGHSSHVTGVRWNKDDRYIVSVGGEDQCVMYWSVNKNKK